MNLTFRRMKSLQCAAMQHHKRQHPTPPRLAPPSEEGVQAYQTVPRTYLGRLVARLVEDDRWICGFTLRNGRARGFTRLFGLTTARNARIATCFLSGRSHLVTAVR